MAETDADAASGRLEREAAFHDHVYEEADVREAARKFYFVVRESEDCYAREILQRGAGRRALEYGCGPGSYAWLLAEHDAQVTGIDISPAAIEQARAEGVRRGADGVEFSVMNAEDLTFADDTVDLVCGTGILHHLDLARAYAEVARVLRPDGAGVFYEPLGHNPAINLYRRRTPAMRTADEHPLRAADLRAAQRHFGRVSVRYFHLASLGAVPLRARRGFGALVRALNRLDRALFRAWPWLGRFAWMAVLVFERPRDAGQSGQVST